MKTAHLKDLLETRRKVRRDAEQHTNPTNISACLTGFFQASQITNSTASSRLPQIKWSIPSESNSTFLKNVDWRNKNHSTLERN